jgi:hypothetical protein
MRLVGERRAVAAAVLAFFGILFAMVAYNAPPELVPLLTGLAGAYAVAFVGLVAQWFWARWYAMGLGFSGLILALIALFQLGVEPVVLFFGGAHVAICLALLGHGAASAFDGRRDWRERFRLDDNGVNRLGKAVTRAGASLPYLILAGLAPREGMSVVLGAVALVAGVAGLHGLIRLRTWGLFALAGAAVAAVGVHPQMVLGAGDVSLLAWPWQLIGSMLCAAAVTPFVPDMMRALRAR